MLQLRIHGATSSLLAVGRGLDDGDAVRGISFVEAVAPGQAVLTAEVRPEAADRVLAAVANRGVPGEDVTLVRLDDVGPITTIPAAAYLGVAAGEGEMDKVMGALAVLGVNIGMLLLGGTATLVLQRRLSALTPRDVRSSHSGS